MRKSTKRCLATALLTFGLVGIGSGVANAQTTDPAIDFVVDNADTLLEAANDTTDTAAEATEEGGELAGDVVAASPLPIAMVFGDAVAAGAKATGDTIEDTGDTVTEAGEDVVDDTAKFLKVILP
ncbi:hypothetical protein [Amycolatopsis anabasis]|uniref:hypothetical protein n=1 Tax=Amycolatopsis anabasis TaxID=1840409 RepID=UPI00131E98A0|nr:hypothetical protein [Amycolatopsis anabasis]